MPYMGTWREASQGVQHRARLLQDRTHHGTRSGPPRRGGIADRIEQRPLEVPRVGRVVLREPKTPVSLSETHRHGGTDGSRCFPSFGKRTGQLKGVSRDLVEGIEDGLAEGGTFLDPAPSDLEQMLVR